MIDLDITILILRVESSPIGDFKFLLVSKRREISVPTIFLLGQFVVNEI
jgi:hypothetical protein